MIGLKSSYGYWTQACCVSARAIQKPIVLTPISPLNGLQSFYSDFARVADDESRHLSWCLQRLDELGYAYGDMVAHSILWDGAQASSGESYGRLLEQHSTACFGCRARTTIVLHLACLFFSPMPYLSLHP